jgi:hypothetical protein
MTNDTTHTDLPSGRFLLRIDPALHALLREHADGAGLSLNEYCSRKLATPGIVDGPSSRAIGHAAEVTEGRLRGVLAFGSWARGELADESDVDLMMVVAPDLAIERDLYRRWDRAPIRWEGRRVEPHFVHLPHEGHRVTGLWAEAAQDGVVLFDPDLSLSRHLVGIRRRILDGRLVRREAHGHAYWVEAA